MNSLNFTLIILITILAVKRSASQYGDLEGEIKAIKEYQNKLSEFVDKYTKDVDEFKKAQAEAGRLDSFVKFEKNLLDLFTKTITTTTEVMDDLAKLRNAPIDIQGEIVRLHFKFVEVREEWDKKFKVLWDDYSQILNQNTEGKDPNEDTSKQDNVEQAKSKQQKMEL